MRRIAAYFSLIAALTGTPLRQAEAVCDLSRSLVELAQAASLEAPDGGVGDDSGVSILGGSQADPDDGSPWRSAEPLSFPVVALAPPDGGRVDSRDRVWRPPDPPQLRRARLQVFLF